MCHFEQHEPPAIQLHCYVTIYFLLLAFLPKPLSIEFLLKLNHHQRASHNQALEWHANWGWRPRIATTIHTFFISFFGQEVVLLLLARREQPTKAAAFESFVGCLHSKIRFTKESGWQVIKLSFSPSLFGILSSLFLIANSGDKALAWIPLNVGGTELTNECQPWQMTLSE